MDLSNEHFLRTTSYPEAIKDGAVRRRAFEPSRWDINEGMSLYRNLPELTSFSDASVFIKWSSRRRKSGHLGICFLLRQFIESIGMTLKEDANPIDPNDPLSQRFEPQHHLMICESSADKCPDKDMQSKLAKHATDMGNFVSSVD